MAPEEVAPRRSGLSPRRKASPLPPSPTDSKEQQVPIARSNGFKIAYEVCGDGPPLVLHPGMFQIGAHWTQSGYTSTLTATHTVITVDPLGLGASDGPQDPAAYALTRRADYVTAVLDDVGADKDHGPLPELPSAQRPWTQAHAVMSANPQTPAMPRAWQAALTCSG
jgi:hypothetical protein